MSFYKQGKVLRNDAREMVYSIIKYFEEEKRSKQYHPYKYSNLRAALATGLSASTISKIRKEGKVAEQSKTKIQTPSKGNRGRNNTRVPLNIATLSNIREIIASLYDAHEIPSVAKIVARGKRDYNLNLASSTLRRILKNKLSFRYERISHNSKLLYECNNIKAQRATYLRRIRSNDALNENKRQVVYVGESIVEVVVNKIKGKKSKIQRYFIIHAGYEDKYMKEATFIFKAEENNDKVHSNQFIRYVQENLIPNLPNRCIIVMDNAPCHNRELNKAPSKMVCKEDIKKWMVDNYMPFEEEWTKAEMLMHIKNNTLKKKYVVDELVTKYGHEVLRLPSYNIDLNPIERIWDLMMERVAKFINADEKPIENFAKESFVSVEEWAKEIDNIKTVERKYWLREVVREKQFEGFITTLRVTSDNDTDCLSEGSFSSDESMQGIEHSTNESTANDFCLVVE